MGIVRDLFIAKKMSAGLKLPAPSSAALINRLYLAGLLGGNETATVYGEAPLTLPKAVEGTLERLIQYGLCTQASTPTLADPVDIYCNRGKLTAVNGEVVVVGSPATANLYDASKRLENVHISWAAVGTTQGMCVSAPIPVERSKTYYARLVCGADTNGTQYDRYVVWMTNDEYPSNDNIVERRYIARKSDGLSEGDSKFESVEINNQSVKYVRLAMQMNDTAVMFSEQASAYQPYIEGEAIVISGNGENLVNTATNITGSFINSSGVITAGADAQYTDLIPVTIGNVYKWTLTSNRPSGGNNRWHGYKSDGTWKTQIAYKNPGAGAGIPFELSAAIPAGVAYVRLSYGIDDTDVELREEILQCATAEPLLAVGSVKDEQDIVSGAVTRRCAACVYDGTQPVGDSYISTTGGKDVGAIIVYPLENATSESVAEQPLNTALGTNVIDVTAEVSPVTLEAAYPGNKE